MQLNRVFYCPPSFPPTSCPYFGISLPHRDLSATLPETAVYTRLYWQLSRQTLRPTCSLLPFPPKELTECEVPVIFGQRQCNIKIMSLFSAVANATGLPSYADLTKLKQKESLFRRGLSERKTLCVKLMRVWSPAALNILRCCAPRQDTLPTRALSRPRSKWVRGRTVKACVTK